jgi:hypothetical protein
MTHQLESPIPAGGRNHLDAPCPICAKRLTNNEAGNVPGAVTCKSCGWHGEWTKTSKPWEMETGGAIAYFKQTLQ